MDYLTQYWFLLTAPLAMLGGWANETYGFSKARLWRWLWPFVFWISVGTAIPDMLHEALWWAGPLGGALFAGFVLSLGDTRDWLGRKRRNKLRRDSTSRR